MNDTTTEIALCLNCELAAISPASLNYCDACEHVDREARGLFDSPHASDAENRSKRSNARIELRRRCFAMKPGALSVCAPKMTEFDDYVVEVRVGGKSNRAKSYFTDDLADARATAEVMRADALRHNDELRRRAAK
jgi:hypothetical protein